MYVLAVSPSQTDREAIGRMLAHGPYRVDLAHDLRTALSIVERGAPPLVVVAWPMTGGPDLLAHLRSRSSGPRAYVVGILDDHAPHEIAGLYAAGADDFMRRPFTHEELLGRLGAPCRIGAWGHSGPPPSPTRVDLSLLQAFQRMGAVVAQELGELLGEPLRVADRCSLAPAGLRGATIPLLLASAGAELHVSVVAEPDALRALGARLLGDPGAGHDALDDVLREMANAAGGAVKRAGLAETVTLTTGLPSTLRGPPPDGPSVRRWGLQTAGAPGLRFGIVGQVSVRETQRVSSACLKEGMVVSHDLRSESGALLVPAGTRLTRTTASRLASALGSRALVEVAWAA